MAAAALLKETPNPTDAEIDAAMTNICRCGTYNRVRAAIKVAARAATSERAGLAIEHRPGAERTEHDMSAPDRAAPPPRGAPSASRRRFLAASAATAGSLVVGFHIPFAADANAQPVATPAAAAPEINAWVVVQPDDTVVIRIARSEMGQGSLTGLAQLVAEELECDWAKVHDRVPDARREPRAQSRVGQFLDRRQPRHPRIAGVRPQGRRRSRARCSCRRRRTGGRCRRANAWPRNSVITHTPTGRTTTYGKVAAVAAKLKAPTDVPLKDPKDWKLAGKRLARLDTVDKVTGAQIYGSDLKLPGMLNAAIKDCPVFGGKVKSVDERRRAEAARREEGRARRRFGGRRRRRHLVAREDRARCAADRMGLRSQCQRVVEPRSPR